MIICPGKQFIFIKNMKVASTSMEIWLSQLCGENALITEIAPEDEETRSELGYRSPQNYKIPWRRYTARDWAHRIIKKRKPRAFKNHDSMLRLQRYYKSYTDFFSFCFERNPWDKAVSYYYYSLYQRNADPEEFSISDLIDDAPNRLSNWDRYTNEDDEIIVDYVATYENLEEELEEICGQIGVSRKSMGSLPRAKCKYRKTRKPYYHLLTNDEAERISQLCQKEISHFGYTYGEKSDAKERIIHPVPSHSVPNYKKKEVNI